MPAAKVRRIGTFSVQLGGVNRCQNCGCFIDVPLDLPFVDQTDYRDDLPQIICARCATVYDATHCDGAFADLVLNVRQNEHLRRYAGGRRG